MNTICSQCGSVLAPGRHVCNFCESREAPPLERQSTQATARGVLPKAREEWRGELNQRLQDYRARRRKAYPNENQSALPFEEPRKVAVQVDEPATPTPPADDFAFTIAIGRIAPKETTDPRVLIDVSNPPEAEPRDAPAVTEPPLALQNETLPVAPLYMRRNALLLDGICLAFAYGSFLALFGSLGGQFTVSKLSAAVCASTLAFVYLQYFGLFTIFGGSTPGMMLCGLQVASTTGDLPGPRQYALRALGYLLSAGTCFLGFFWVLWDEEGLTWHDRISNTYLTSMENFADEEASHAATTQ